MEDLSRHSRAEINVLNTLRKKREELEAKRDQLDFQITELQASYGEIYNRDATIVSLPAEILCMIFEIAQGYMLFGSSRAPLMEITITHICRRWREVALSYPKLWTSFIYSGSKRIPEQRLLAYLERSQMQPIDLWFDFSSFEEHRCPQLMKLLTCIVPHVSRWRRLAVVTDKDNPILNFHTQLITSAAPQLEYLLISPGIVDPSDGLEAEQHLMQRLEPRILTGGAPKLQHVRMDSHSPPRFLPPLSNVTILRFEEGYEQTGVWISWNTFVEILSLPFLKALSIYGRHVLAPEGKYSSVMARNLEHLRVGHDENVTEFIPYIVAPLLGTLVLQVLVLPERPQDDVSVPFPALHTLTITDCQILNDESIIFLSWLTANVKNLTISHEPGNESLLTYINEHLHYLRLWEHLQTLTCNLSNYGRVADYHDFVHHRDELSLPVQTLWVPSRFIDRWTDSGDLLNLTAHCSVEALPENSELGPVWPPGYDTGIDDDDDIFRVDIF